MEPEVVSHRIAPVFDARSRVLVLGTMPSPASRARGGAIIFVIISQRRGKVHEFFVKNAAEKGKFVSRCGGAARLPA